MSVLSNKAHRASETRPQSSMHCSKVNHYCGCIIRDNSFRVSRIKLSEIDPKLFFERYIATRTPVVLEGALADSCFTSLKKWQSNEYLDALSGEELVQVEYRANELEAFGQGREIEMRFHSFLQLQDRGDELHYLTTQDVEEGNSGRPELMAPFVQRLSDDFPLRPAIMGNLIPQNINVWMGHAKNGASSGLHHDYHDNMYILLRGKKSFRLYSPADAERLYTRGKLAYVHHNGRINYEGEITTSYGADPSSEAASLAATEKEEAEQALILAERALENGDLGAKDAFEKAELCLEAAMDAILSAEYGDESDIEGESSSINDSDEGEARDDPQDEDYTSSPASSMAPKRRKVDRTVANPLNFSKIDAQLLQDPTSREQLNTLYPEFQHAQAAFCEVNAGDILYLPASWFHEVRSYGASDGHLALNYWFHPPDQLSNYEEPYSSPFWSRDFLLRALVSIAVTEAKKGSRGMSATRGILRLSPSLQHLLGKSELTRPAAMKEFWAYVKRHQLQHPNDGRIIQPNEEMKRAFGVDHEIHFNQVAKFLTQHLHK